MKKRVLWTVIIWAMGQATTCISQNQQVDILTYVVDLKGQDLRFFGRDDEGSNYGSIRNLYQKLLKENVELIFAMNGGMYTKTGDPQGLYIENKRVLAVLDTQKVGYGNFYKQPNGVFYTTTSGGAQVISTSDFQINSDISYATQSGPMLLIDGALHPQFNPGSKHRHIRNGVGILPDGKVLFAMSKHKINFFDFAKFFLDRGCQNALYLDGYVSRAYLPSKKWVQWDGNFGVIIGVVKSGF